MPTGDRTGPDGFGPMTGRGLGICAGNDAPGYTNPGPGRGMGRGFGRGMGRGFRGRRSGYGYGYAPVPPEPSKDEEINMLNNQAKSLERTLENIRKRINGLKKDSD